MKTIAHINRKTVCIMLFVLFLCLLLIVYSHIFTDAFRNGMYYNIFGEALPYVAYLLIIFSFYYFASMLWLSQAYLSSDGNQLIELKGSKIALREIDDVSITRGSLGIKNITILGKFQTINIRSHWLQEESLLVVNSIKKEAGLL